MRSAIYGIYVWRNGSAGIRLCEPQPRRYRNLRVVPVLLGMARHLAVGGAARRRCALRDACDDVFKDRICGVGNRDGDVVARTQDSVSCNDWPCRTCRNM